jgi:hypothetical protein
MNPLRRNYSSVIRCLHEGMALKGQCGRASVRLIGVKWAVEILGLSRLCFGQLCTLPVGE